MPGVGLDLGHLLLLETSWWPRMLSALAEDRAFRRAVWLQKSLLGTTLNTADVLHTKKVLHENKNRPKGN